MKLQIFHFRKDVCSFRRWSRSKFGILRSLHSVVKICTLVIVYNIIKGVQPVIAQSDSTVIAPLREVDEVEVIGKKSLLLPGTGVMVISVPISGLQQYPSAGLQDIIEFAGNIDVRQRGRNGVQSDISVRGGSFDHVLVLLNGFNMNDPQTGHGNMDLPVDQDIIERIEVSYGPSSMLYGPGAFTGAVNIITEKAESSSVMAGLEAGAFGLLKSKVNIFQARGRVSSLLSMNRQSSAGYAPDTDFKIYNIYFNTGYSSPLFSASVQTGYQNKRFGASGFYTPLFPHQYEKTGLYFTGIKIETGRKFRLMTQLYFRRRYDEFLLDRYNPSFYRNFHRTDVYGGRISVIRTSGRFSVESAFDIRSENIISNSLGNKSATPVKVKGADGMYYDRRYGRDVFALSNRLIYKHNRTELTAGLNVTDDSGNSQGLRWLPAIGFEYAIATNIRLFADLNAGSAIPSFTDLFYKDPNNEGSSGLRNASIVSAGTGIKFSGGQLAGSVSIFASKGDNIVEWLWSDEFRRFKPFNTSDYYTSGIEGTAGYAFMTRRSLERSITASYMYLYITKPGIESAVKYSNLRHKLSVMLSGSLQYNFRLSFNISFQDRMGSYITYTGESYVKTPFQPVWLSDLNIEWHYRNVLLFAGASNILNTIYSDAGSLNQPGRWFSAGIKLNCTGKR